MPFECQGPNISCILQNVIFQSLYLYFLMGPPPPFKKMLDPPMKYGSRLKAYNNFLGRVMHVSLDLPYYIGSGQMITAQI